MISQSAKVSDAFYQHNTQKANIGPSSLKIFDGEDLSLGNRKRLNQMQVKNWLDQQTAEKEMAKSTQKYADRYIPIT
jgi:RIB43A